MEAMWQPRNLDLPPPPTRKTNHTPAVLSDLNRTLTRDIKLQTCKMLPQTGVLLQHETGTAYYGHVPSVATHGSWAVNASDGF